MSWLDKVSWGRVLGYALASAAATVVFIIALATVNRIFFDAPPITTTSLDPPNLGVLCPGEEVFAHNRVSIGDRIIVIFYISTLDVTGSRNIIGTQSAFTDLLHPRKATFEQVLPWQVPDIEPGRYRRVIAARNVADDQRTVFAEATFEIGEECP